MSILVIVLDGIYGGVVTVIEAAALGVVLTLFFTMFRKKLTVKGYWRALKDMASTTGMKYVIIIGGNVFSYFLTVTNMPAAIVTAIGSWQLPTPLILVMLLIVYLVLGSIFVTAAGLALMVS